MLVLTLSGNILTKEWLMNCVLPRFIPLRGQVSPQDLKFHMLGKLGRTDPFNFGIKCRKMLVE